mgnify:CR=1 FL=1
MSEHEMVILALLEGSQFAVAVDHHRLVPDGLWDDLAIQMRLAVTGIGGKQERRIRRAYLQ